MKTYKLTFLDAEGSAITCGATHSASDGQVIASAAQTLRRERQFEAVEILEGERLVRRLTRAEVARRKDDA